MSGFSWIGLSFALAAVGAALLTPVVVRLAWRLGALARPRPDRWHQHPTALLGGVAIYLASSGTAALVLPHVLAARATASTPWLAVWAGATLVFALGLLDDRRGLGPGVKLAGQAAAAALLILPGIHVPCVSSPWLSAPLTILWVVGITNAVNLLDNMDGVLTGVVAIAALMIAGLSGGPGAVSVLALALAGACCGFLVYNFHPAQIFMGDGGSLYLGFSVSALSLMAGMEQEGSGAVRLFVPVVLLAVPIFDTVLVIVTRWRSGRPVMEGGRDHTSHRLAALGISERGVALLLYTVSALLGALALAAVRLPLLAAAALAVGGVGALGLLGVVLARVPVRPTAKERSGTSASSNARATRLSRPAPPPHAPVLHEPST